MYVCIFQKHYLTQPYHEGKRGQEGSEKKRLIFQRHCKRNYCLVCPHHSIKTSRHKEKKRKEKRREDFPVERNRAEQ